MSLFLNIIIRSIEVCNKWIELVEGPHLYQINDYYYLFAAQGGTVFTHQEVVARSKTLDTLSFETEPGDPFITNFDTPDNYIQKQGRLFHLEPQKDNNNH